MSQAAILNIFENFNGIFSTDEKQFFICSPSHIFLLRLSCVCSWAAFASYFDRYTNTFSVFWRHDGRDHIPACVYDFSEHSNTEKGN